MKQILNIIFSSNNRLSNILLAAIYSLVYDYMYENFVYKLFYYIGRLDYEPMTVERGIIWILLSSLPLLNTKE